MSRLNSSVVSLRSVEKHPWHAVATFPFLCDLFLHSLPAGEKSKSGRGGRRRKEMMGESESQPPLITWFDLVQ